MSEAVVDLPDPISPSPAVAGNADELLAQLAGEQIDRLLSDSEEPAAPMAPPPAIETQPIAVPLTPPPAEAAPLEAPAATMTLEALQHDTTTDAAADDDSAIVRALEVINIPLASSPQWVRDLLGTVAVMTFVNAVAAIVFIVFFRHR